MNLYEYIRNSIKYQVELGNREFAIYPYGEKGRFAQKVLREEFCIKERYVADGVCHAEKDVQSLEYLKKDYMQNKEFLILLVSDYNSPYSLKVHQEVTDFAGCERIIDTCSISLYFNPWNYFGKFKAWNNFKNSVTECIQREIYRNGVEGAVAEAGVYKGKTARHINYMFPDRSLYLFDTFCGFDEKDQKYDDDKRLYRLEIDYSDTSVDLVLERMMFPQNCIVKKGWFPDSAVGVNDRFAFVRLDMDLYEPIKAGLEFFYPKMNPGGYIAVHDCRSKNFDGARAALIDFCRQKHLNYVNMQDDLGTAVIAVGF